MQTLISGDSLHTACVCVRAENKAVCLLPYSNLQPYTSCHLQSLFNSTTQIPIWERERQTELEAGRDEEEGRKVNEEGGVITQRVCLCAQPPTADSKCPSRSYGRISLFVSWAAVLLSASSGPSPGLSTLLSSSTADDYCSTLFLLPYTQTGQLTSRNWGLKQRTCKLVHENNSPFHYTLAARPAVILFICQF